MITVNVDFNNKALEALFKSEMKSVLATSWMMAELELKPVIGELVTRVMKANRAYSSLLNGALQEEFGFRSSQSSEIVNSVIESVATATQFTIIPSGEFNIGVFRSDFSDAMSSNHASYTSYSQRGSFVIEWLSWFLFSSGEAVVKNFSLVRGAYTPTKSRSTRAIMVPSTKDWAVPSEAGTKDDNWITQSVDMASDDFIVAVETYLRKIL